MTKQTFKVAVLACGLLSWLIAPVSAHAQAQPISVGISAAMTGPASELGLGMLHGMETYFKKINAQGGIDGRRIRVISMDDGYEPARAAPNMRAFSDDPDVLAVLGNVGTPTAVVTVPIANLRKMLMFGAFTGAEVLRQNDRYVINYRASYAQETATMVDGLLKMGIDPKKIAFFTQNDAGGDAGYKGAIRALRARGVPRPSQLAHGRYKRNTDQVKKAVKVLLEAKPEAVIMVGAYQPVAKAIKLAKRRGLKNTYFLNLSFVGSQALARALCERDCALNSDKVIVTQVVPPPTGDDPLVKEYQSDLAQYGVAGFRTPGFVTLEGYTVAKLFTHALKQAAKGITRESIVDALLNTKDYDIGISDCVMNLSEGRHQASHKVWPTILKNGEYQLFEWD